MGVNVCRRCSRDLDIVNYCTVCNSPNEFRCSSCGYIRTEKNHAACKLIDMNYEQFSRSGKQV